MLIFHLGLWVISLKFLGESTWNKNWSKVQSLFSLCIHNNRIFSDKDVQKWKSRQTGCCDLMKQLLMFNIFWNLRQKLLLQWNVLRAALQLKRRRHQILEYERNLLAYPQKFLDKSHNPLCFWVFFLFEDWINKQNKKNPQFWDVCFTERRTFK